MALICTTGSPRVVEFDESFLDNHYCFRLVDLICFIIIYISIFKCFITVMTLLKSLQGSSLTFACRNMYNMDARHDSQV